MHRSKGGHQSCLVAIWQRLLNFKTARDQIRLVTNSRQLVSQTGEPQRIDRAVVSLQIIDAAHHRFRSSHEFVRHGNPAQTPGKLLFLTFDEARQKSEFLIEVAARNIRRRRTRVDHFLANLQDSPRADRRKQTPCVGAAH